MIKATFTDYISKCRGMVVRYVLATWPATRSHTAGSVTVYREFENGKKQVRKLCYRPISGYCIDPRDSDKWCSAIMECNAISNGYNVYGHALTDKEIETIVDVHPNFKWTLQKAGSCSCAKALKLLQQWIKDPNIELLVGAHYDSLAMNKSFVRYSKEKRMAVLNFIRKNPGSENWSLHKIKFVMDGHTEKEYDDWKNFRDVYSRSFSYESYKYLTSRTLRKGDLELYRDYIAMAKECGHNIKDKYWYAPKNLRKAHDKVMKEVELIKKARLQELAEKAKKDALKKDADFRKFAKRFKDLISNTKGLTAYVPQDTQEVDIHAKALHQCLVYADYIGKMARRKCLLVFIVNSKGKPVATAEILPGGTLGQFYANEKFHDKRMMPSEDAKNALGNWLKSFKDKKISFKPAKEAA